MNKLCYFEIVTYAIIMLGCDIRRLETVMTYLPNRRYITQRMESIIRSLLGVLLQDLINGAEKEHAGWRTPSSLRILDADLKELSDLRAIQRNTKGQVRYNMDNRQMHRALQSPKGELTQLNYFLENMPVIRRDRERVKGAEGILNQVCQVLQDHPENWAYIIWVGWWKMLESSGLPAPIDNVLKEGISPKDWGIIASLACPDLALSVAEKCGDATTIYEAQKFFKENNLVAADESPPAVRGEKSQKVERILRWEEVTEGLDDGLTKMLAFVWASLYFLANRDLVTRSEEASFPLYDTIWSKIKDLLNEDQPVLLEKLKNTVNTLAERGVTWAADVLHVPEVI